MTKHIDFDAFRAEQKQTPVTLKIGGKVYNLPASLPASIAIELVAVRATLADDADVPVKMLDDVGRAIFGNDVWLLILHENRIQVDELGPLIEMVLAAYSPARPAEGTEDPQAASTQET